jgi:hypothetical protein
VAQKFITPITVKQLASAGSDAVTIYVDADTYARLKIEAGGRLTWGSGSATGDVNLYRDSADVLKTDDTFKVPALFVDSIEVDTTGATTNQVLKFDGTKFAPGTASTVGSIDDLSDVDTTTTAPTTNQYLKWNGTNWVPSTVSAGGIIISDTAPSSPTSGQIWFESDTAQTFVYYDSSWIEIGASSITASVQGSAPASPVSGQIWLNSSTNIAYIYYGSSWIDIGAASLISTINAKGDIYVGTADNTVAALTVGSADQVLTVDSSTATGLKWASIPTINSLDDVADVTITTATTNDVLQWNGTAWVNVAASTVGATNLDGLSDVVVTSPLQFQGLMYDGTNWVNSNIPNVYLVRNNTGSTILKGTLVGAVGAEPSGRIDVAPFEVTGTENSELRAMGIAVSNISNGVNGEVMSFGTLTGLDTRGSTASALAVGDETWAAGDILFAHPTVNGKLTNVRPQHDLAVAFITVRHASTGQISIRIIPGNNHLEWMHDVSLVDKTSGDFLKYNGTAWVNDAIDLGTDTTGNYVQSLVAGTGVTLTNNSGESATPTVAVDTAVIQARVTNVTDTEIGYLDGVTSAIQTQIDAKAPLSSPTFTGTPTLPTGTIATTQTAGNNTTAVATTAFVATAVSGATVVVSSATAPVSPTAGLVWFDTSTGASYIYYNSAWVELGGGTMSPYQATSSTRPSSPWTGQHVYETNTKKELTWDGSAWSQQWNMPWGIIAKATGTTVGLTTTLADIGTSVTFTAIATRQYKYTFYAYASNATAAGTLETYITDSSNNITGSLNLYVPGGGNYTFQNLTYISTETAGSVTRKVRAKCQSGTGTIFGEYQLFVEDIGPA